MRKICHKSNGNDRILVIQLRKSIMEKDKDPYQTLCSLILNNQGIYTNGIKYEYRIVDIYEVLKNGIVSIRRNRDGCEADC